MLTYIIVGRRAELVTVQSDRYFETVVGKVYGPLDDVDVIKVGSNRMDVLTFIDAYDMDRKSLAPLLRWLEKDHIWKCTALFVAAFVLGVLCFV